MDTKVDSKAPVLKKAWDKFNASMEASRQAIEAAKSFDDPAHRAQGYYSLMEAQAMAYNWVVAPRLNHPRIFTHTAWATYLYTIAGNCPDIIYSVLPLDGKHTYRVRGRHGDVRLLLMQVMNKPMGVEGSRCTGNYEFAKSDSGSDVIDIILSPTRQEGNWVPLDPESDLNVVFLRRFLLDWEEDPGEIDIEMIGELKGYDELSETALAKRIEMAADFNLAIIKNWGIGFYEFVMKMSGDKFNSWTNIPGEVMANIAGSATCNYAFLPFDIKPDEAIVIEMDVPEGSAYWSFQLIDVWDKSLDFMHEQTDFNMKGAAIDADGKVRAVISFSDPGIKNWLNPMGRHQGICALRNYRSKTFTNPICQLVKTSDIFKHLPADTVKVTSQERKASVERRRPAILRLYRG